MQTKIRIKSVLILLIEYILAFVIILRTYTMFERDPYYGFSVTTTNMVLTVCCMVRILLSSSRKKLCLERSFIHRILIAAVISFLCVTVPRYNVVNGIIGFFFPLTMLIMMFAFCKNWRCILHKLSNIMFVIAIISLFFYFFGTILGAVSASGYANFRYGEVMKSCRTFYRLYYEAQRQQGTQFLQTSYRNTGIFIEAPMYNIMLCVAHAAELSFEKKHRPIVVAVLTITIISTFTTTGILYLLCVCVIFVLNSGKEKIVKALKFVAFPLVLLLICFIILEVVGNKLETVSGSNSFSVRMEHMISFFRMWMDRPLFGFGYGNEEAFYQYTSYKQGYSLGLPALLGRSGGAIFCLYFIPWISWFIKSLHGNRKELYFLIGTFVCLFLTAVIYQPVLYLIIALQLLHERTSNTDDMQERCEKRRIGVAYGSQSLQNIRG